MLLSLPTLAAAQGTEYAGRPVAEVRVQGLVLVPQELVRNQLRMDAGDPYDPETVENDIVRLTHLGRFNKVEAVVDQTADGTLVLTYLLSEQPLLSDVQVVGNKAISDQELLALVQLRSGDPADPFLLDQGKRRILAAYEEEGFFAADVNVDEELLFEQGILIFRVREGPRVRIRDFRFEGNEAFDDKVLRTEIDSRTYFPIFRKGRLSREQLQLDAGAVRGYYRDRGYLDAQVGRRIDISADETDAVVTFVVDEGPLYTVEQVQVEGITVFPAEQVRLVMPLDPGATYTEPKVRESVENLRDLYGKLGYIEARIDVQRLFHEDQPKVDVLVQVEEGQPYTVGKVSVRGNELTKSKVVLRQVRGMEPGRPFDREGLDTTRRRLRENPLFSEGTVTVLGSPEDEVRDVLVEVQEGQTGSVTFGAGISSDAGVVGAISVVQRNFDIADLPESFGEFVTGRAFRGAGQYFSLQLEPGSEQSRYAVSFREPYLLETDFFLDLSGFFFQREREDWDEQRFGGSVGIGQRFGDIYSASVGLRAEQVEISDIDPSAPVDAFDVEGSSFLTSVGLTFARDTTDSRIFPSEGSVASLTLDRFGALGGDYEFTRLRSRFQAFFTVDEDFLERRTVISTRLEVGYIFEEGEAPLFERFYAGGHRSFRGFEYRGVGPRGIRADTGEVGEDPVGGQWQLLTGVQYEFPLLDQFLRGVIFTDMGTVQNDVALDDWRVSIGTGVRLKIPFLSQAPFALDLAVPLVKQDGDETQLLSFDLEVPIR
jgi:outer membrane protein insertion porin family